MDPEHSPSRFVLQNKKGKTSALLRSFQYQTSVKQSIKTKKEKYDFMKFHSKEQIINCNCMVF